MQVFDVMLVILHVFFLSLSLSISTIILIIFGADDGAPGVGKEKTKKQKSSRTTSKTLQANTTASS